MGQRGCGPRLPCFPGRSGAVRAAGAAPESCLGPRPTLPAATGLPLGIPRHRARRPSSKTFRLMALRLHKCSLVGEPGLSLRPLWIKKGPVRCQKPSGPTAVLGSPGLSLGVLVARSRKGPREATGAGRASGHLLHMCLGGRPSAPRAGTLSRLPACAGGPLLVFSGLPLALAGTWGLHSQLAPDTGIWTSPPLLASLACLLLSWGPFTRPQG